MKTTALFAIALTSLIALSVPVNADAAGGRFAKKNAAGGMTAGSAVNRSGENGSIRRTRGLTTDGQGNAIAGRAAEVQTANGGIARRSGSTTVSADGSVNHQGQTSASGPRGSVDSTGGFTRDANGNIAGQRSTSATNAATGNSVNVDTNVTRTDGVIDSSRTKTCTDAAGNVIACKR
jgi:hypothetical protein